MKNIFRKSLYFVLAVSMIVTLAFSIQNVFSIQKNDVASAYTQEDYGVKFLGKLYKELPRTSISDLLKEQGETNSAYEGWVGGAIEFSQDTLTLYNVTLKGNFTKNIFGFEYNSPMKIVLVGESIVANNSSMNNVLTTYDCDITITGSGKLTIPEQISGAISINNGNLTLDGCNLDIQSKTYAINLTAMNHKLILQGLLKLKLFASNQNGSAVAIQNVNDVNCDLSGYLLKAGQKEEVATFVQTFAECKDRSQFFNIVPKPQIETKTTKFDLNVAKCENIKMDVDLKTSSIETISATYNFEDGSVQKTLVKKTEETSGDYTITFVGEREIAIEISKEVVVKEAYEKKLNQVTITISFSSGYEYSLLLEIVDTTPTKDVPISTSSAIYNAKDNNVVSFSVKLLNRFDSIENLTAGIEYEYQSDTGVITFKATYLKTLPNGSYDFGILFNFEGTKKMFTLFVVGVETTPPVDPDDPNFGVGKAEVSFNSNKTLGGTFEFDKFVGNENTHTAFLLSLKLNKDALLVLSIDGEPLLLNVDYIRADDAENLTVITISTSKLGKLVNGTHVLSISFKFSETKKYEFEVVNTSPIGEDGKPTSPPIVKPILPGDTGGSSTPDETVPDKTITADGKTATIVVASLFLGVFVISLAIWIVLRKKHRV